MSPLIPACLEDLSSVYLHTRHGTVFSEDTGVPHHTSIPAGPMVLQEDRDGAKEAVRLRLKLAPSAWYQRSITRDTSLPGRIEGQRQSCNQSTSD